MKTIKNIFIILSLALFLGACTEKIDIKLDSTYERLIVEGYIDTDTTTHWVRLTKSADYYSGNPATVVSSAIVKLSDGFESLTLIENNEKPGYYETPSDFYGVVGRTYELNIELAEAIGDEKNFSSSNKIMSIGTIDSIQVEYNPDWEIYEIKIFAWEPPTTDFYKFEVLKNGDLLTDSINKVWISDDKYFNGNYTFGALVGFLDPDDPREEPQSGDTITLRMSSITKEYYNYILELQDQTFQYRNPLFSGPPANVSTNIENALGFFAAYSVAYSSTIYK